MAVVVPIAGFSGIATSTPRIVVVSAQVQTKCPNPGGTPHVKSLGPDDKFCSECGERTDYGKYTDAMEAAATAEQRSNRRGAAAAYLEAAIKRVSDVRKSAALTGAGRNLLEAGQRDDASRELVKARRLDPKNAEAALLTGRVEFENKQFQAATTLFQEANQLAQKDSFAALWLGEIAFESKNNNEALRQYALAEPENAQSYRLALHYGYVLRALRRNDEAIQRFERARTLEPLSFEPVIELAELYTSEKKLRQAAELWGRAGDLKPTSVEYPLRQAAMFVELDDYDKAYTAYRVAIGRDQNSFEALIGLATIEILKNSLIDADLHLASARKIRPDNMQAELLHGLVKDVRDPKPVSWVVQHDAADKAPAWHPAGMRIAFQTNRDKSEQIYIQTLGSPAVKLTSGSQNNDPCWSPDGKMVAFHSKRGNMEIVAVDVATKREVQLTTNPANDESPHWHPNGKVVAFMSNRGANRKVGIYVVDVETKEVSPLIVGDHANRMPRWSPDGSKILFISDRSGKKKLWTANADGSNPQMLTNGTDEEGSGSWSPDGTRVAYCVQARGVWSVWIANVGTKQSARLNPSTTESELEPAWNPNGVRILTSIGVKTKASGSTDAYGAPISGGFKENFEIRSQVAPRVDAK